MKIFYFFVVALAWLASSHIALADNSAPIGITTQYFRGVEQKRHTPELPHGRVDDKELAVLKSQGHGYITAKIRLDGKVASIKAIKGGKVQWHSDYVYGTDGQLLTGRRTDSSGAYKIYQFSKSGQLASSSWFNSKGRKTWEGYMQSGRLVSAYTYDAKGNKTQEYPQK